MARKSHGQVEDAQIDMTPMLDVVFIMLIFFITTASFVKEAGVTTQRPEANQAVARTQANVFVGVTDNDQIWIDKRQVEVNTVRRAIETIRQETPIGAVVIQADKKAKAGIVVAVLDQIRAAGVEDVSVAATVE